jgi:hypothetical protein
MWRDPFSVFYGVMQSVWVRLMLFVATIFLGGLVGPAIPTMLAGGISFYVALCSSMVALAVLILTESARLGCLALGVNWIAWSWMTGIFMSGYTA